MVSWTLRLGIGVIILAIAVDPFSQQLVQLESTVQFVDDLWGQKAVNSRATVYDVGELVPRFSTAENSSSSDHKQFMDTRMGLSTEAAILGAFTNGTSIIDIEERAFMSCPTNNCTWPTFDSLGVCHQCSNITSELKRVDNMGSMLNFMYEDINPEPLEDDLYSKENGTAYALPNGHFLANVNGYPAPVSEGCHVDVEDTFYNMTAYSTSNPNLTNTMKDGDSLIWSTSVIYSYNLIDETTTLEDFDTDNHCRKTTAWPKSPVQAYECGLYYCVKTIDSSVQNGKIQNSIEQSNNAQRDPSSWRPKDIVGSALEEHYKPENIPQNGKEKSLEFDPYYAVIRMTDLVFNATRNGTEQSYRVTQRAIESLGAYLQKALVDDTLTSKERLRSVENEIGEDSVGFNGLLAGETPVPERIRGIWEGETGRQLEYAFEKLAIGITNDIRDNGLFIDGQVGVAVTLYRIQWYWITLHGVILIGGISFCLLTMQQSSRVSDTVPPWKTSALAAMSQAPEAVPILGDIKDLEEMEKKAQDTMLSLSRRRSSQSKDNQNSDSDRLL